MEENKKITFGKVIKWIGICIIITISFLLFLGLFQRCDTSIVNKIIFNETTVDAYIKDTENFEVRNYDISDKYRSIDNGKLLMISNLCYIKGANQLQFTIKYNKDIVKNPSLDIPFSLYIEDADKNIYSDYFYETDERYKFRFIRVCFENIVLEDLAAGLDENGNQNMKSYELYIDMLDENREPEKFQSFSIYTGNKIYKKVNFTPDKIKNPS